MNVGELAAGLVLIGARPTLVNLAYMQIDRIRWKVRRGTCALRMVPHFIILGGMKCGSTALYNYLIQHPDILPALRKEVHFFDWNYKKGLSWYRAFFPLKYVHGSKVTGEASPSYLFHPLVAERIHECLPGVKLIVLLRNPVDRAYSHYTRRKGFEELSFSEALAAEKARLAGEEDRIRNDPSYRIHSFYAHSYVERGLYARQLKRYFELFDQGQICVVQSEMMLLNPQHVVDEVSQFLGLRPRTIADIRIRNRGNYERKYTREHNMLYERFLESNEELFKLIGKRFDWDR